MNTQDIAHKLVELCRRGDHLGAQRALYAKDAVSTEPDGSTTHGLDGIHGKAKEFDETFEVHQTTVSDPIVAGDYFACTMTVDVTNRKAGGRMTLSELCVYEAKDGKVAREQFFFRQPGQ